MIAWKTADIMGRIVSRILYRVYRPDSCYAGEQFPDILSNVGGRSISRNALCGKNERERFAERRKERANGFAASAFDTVPVDGLGRYLLRDNTGEFSLPAGRHGASQRRVGLGKRCDREREQGSVDTARSFECNKMGSRESALLGHYTESLARPLRRRRTSTRRPLAVAARLRNPWVLARLRFFG